MNKIKEIRFIDLFSGIGGMRKGLERSNLRTISDGGSEDGSGRIKEKRGRHNAVGQDGFKTKTGEYCKHANGSSERQPTFRHVWSNDINKYANQVYTHRFGEADHYSGDVRGVNPRNIPDFDLLCAGFPCQSFSVAGKGKGFQDTRGSLFFEISRIAEAKRPQMLLLENVKGLLSNDRGQTFKTILQELGRIGYWAEWQILNSKHHGVPQNRERVFIIGHLRNGSTSPIFPLTKGNGLSIEESGKRGGIASTLDANYYKGARRQRTFIASRIPLKFLERNEKNWVKDEAYTVDSVNTGGVIIANTVDQDGYLRRGARNRDENGKSVITSICERRIRRLTPVECERLQGFPDGWTEGVSDTQRYKCLGNAVTVNVIEFLGHRLRASINSKSIRT